MQNMRNAVIRALSGAHTTDNPTAPHQLSQLAPRVLLWQALDPEGWKKKGKEKDSGDGLMVE